MIRELKHLMALLHFSKWGKTINEFLWICAGANREILRKCPTESAKYAGIGGTILFTTIMAVLSGSYALYFVFESNLLAMVFGLLWGLLIFNIERFVNNTLYSDGKATISLRELYYGLPRIIMSILLGIVISTPLVMKMFEERINMQLVRANQSITMEEWEYGFCARYKAFEEVKKNDSELKIVSLFIVLFLIIIEVAPSIFKMMIASGPYDDYLRAEKEKARILSDHLIDETKKEVILSTQKNRERLEAEVLANKELMDKIAKTQAELLQTAIDKWREEELVKITENPSAYIKSNNAS